MQWNTGSDSRNHWDTKGKGESRELKELREHWEHWKKSDCREHCTGRRVIAGNSRNTGNTALGEEW